MLAFRVAYVHLNMVFVLSEFLVCHKNSDGFPFPLCHKNFRTAFGATKKFIYALYAISSPLSSVFVKCVKRWFCSS
jgi:hypothetical protein